MANRKKILLPRSSIPGRAPTPQELDFGEIAINTHDGKAFIKRQANGEVTIESIGSEEVENVFYVSKSGDFGNDGRSLMNSFKTLDSAVATVTARQGFKFDEVTCERDLHLIMDAVRYDMLLDTNFNSVTAGNSYKRGNAAKVRDEQKYQTRRSINEERVGMISAPLVASNTTATERIVKGFTEIIDIFYDGEPDDLYFTDPPVEASTDANTVAQIIQDNRTLIQDAVVTYINNAYIQPYNAAKCSRDVGLIIDAVANDLILGTDYNTVTAGWAYNRANSAYVLNNQKEITIEAINYARDLVKAISGVTSDATIDTLFANVTNVIDGTQTVYPTINYPTTFGSTYQTTDRVNAATALQSNRAAIISDLTTYITTTYPTLQYDTAKCERDTGYIVDALTHDVKYGGNTASRINAEAYFVGTQNQLGYSTDEINATIDGYNQLANVIIPVYIATVAEETRVQDLVTIITDVLTAGNTDSLPARVDIDVSGLANSERQLILDEKSSIQTQTIDYVDSTWAIKTTNIKSYDAGKCSRDVGLILDAVARDLILTTDYNTKTAGWAYKRANSAYVLTDQNAATLGAIDFAQAFIEKLVSADLSTLFDNVTNPIDETVLTYPSISYPTTAGSTYQTADRSTASANIQTNRQTIIDDLTTWIAANYPSLVYDSEACERDVGYILDALSHDIKYGGNVGSRISADAYFLGTESQLGAGEVDATIAAYGQLKVLVNTYVTTGPEQTRAGELIDIVIEVIEDRSTDNLDAKVEVDLTGITANLTDYNIILDNIDDTQDAVIAYVDREWPARLPDYDQDLCYRDVGLILDAVKRDLITGSNYNTTTAAFSYIRENSAYVLSDQKTNTVNAIEYAQKEIKQLAGVTSDATIDSLFEIIYNVINGDITVYPALTYPVVGTHATTIADRATFVSNLQDSAIRTSLIDQTIAFINLNISGEYNATKCRRDLGFLLDGLAFDVLYDGNTAARSVATSYVSGVSGNSLIAGQESITVDAYTFLRDLILGDPVTPAGQPPGYGIADDPTATAVQLDISAFFTVVNDYINNNDNLADEEEISTAGLTSTEFDAIEAAKLTIQDDTIAYVNDFFFNPAYDAGKCARDIGKILDSVALEYLTRDVFPTTFVALSYRRPNAQEVYLKQRAATLAAVRYCEELVKGYITTGGGDATRTDAMFDRIIDGINAGEYTSGTNRVLVDPLTNNYNGTAGGVDGTGSTTGTLNAQATLVAEADNYVTDTLDYVNNTLGITSFDNTKCGEDIKMLIQSLAYDVDTGGNWATREIAESYFVGVVNQLGNDAAEVNATILAYENLKTNITTNLDSQATSNGTPLGAQSASIISYITDLIDYVINVIQEETLDDLPAVIYPSTTGEDATDVAGFNAIINNRQLTQNKIIDFVNDSNPVSSFDDEKCARDVGLIADAIAVDLINNTNYNSITAGLAYQRGNANKVQDDQLTYTVQSINYLRDLINGDTSTQSEKDFVTARIKEITQLLQQSTDYGQIDGDPIDFPSDETYDIPKRQAANALRAQRTRIIRELTDWIFENFDTFEYDVDKCERDTGYLIDALTHDILYDLNFASETAARSYWVGRDLNIEGNDNQAENLDGEADTYFNQLGTGFTFGRPTLGTVENEVQVTSLAYEQLKTIIKKYVLTAGEQSRVDALLDIIINSITADASVGPTGIPNTTINDFNTFGQAIQAAKEEYKREVTFFANRIFPVNTYDQNRCRRDVGFILDSLTYDLKYGGNSATSIAMRSYFSIFNTGYGDLLGDNEYTMTIAAYKQLKLILDDYFGNVVQAIKTRKNNLLDIIINAISQTTAGTFQIGDFFNAPLRNEIYQYNYPTGLATGFDVQTFPDLVALGYKVVFNDLFEAHQSFNLNSSERLTIIRSSAAVARNQGTDSTIFLKSGDYVVNNPIKLPPKTSIIGDALRSTTIRPKNVDSDIFWADNGIYIKEITFRDHQDGAACLAFDPRVDSPGAGTFITQSPYVQNCTSLTTSGLGLKIDGSKVSGLRSMVLDAFTQFNAGGTGVHLLNRGYAQLVSLFTVSTTTSVLATTGGQCSLTNSNSSFGERGLVATGGSPSLYNGDLHANYIQNDDVVRINTITTQDSADYTLNIGDYKKPNYNDAIRFDSDNYYYTVLDVSDEITQDWGITGNTEETVQYANNGQTLDGGFGWATHISDNDNYLAISEIDDTSGKVEIYERDTIGGVPVWQYEAAAAPIPPFGSPSDSDQFGDNVILSADGGYLAVSAPGQKQITGGGSLKKNGAVYTYRRTGDAWAQDAFVGITEVNDRDRQFSSSFDMAEDGLTLAAATVDDTGLGTQGAVYIFLRTNPASSTWTQQQRLACPDGAGVSVTQPVVQISRDGTDLLISWRGFLDKVYYYQRNIDNQFILAQVILPKSNFIAERESYLRMNPEATHFILGDALAPRGYFVNTQTDPANNAPLQIRAKQNLADAVLTNAPNSTITSADADVNFLVDFPTNTEVVISGAGANDGTYTITARTQTTITLTGTFPAPGSFPGMQIYVPEAGVAEMFVFEEGQWVTQDIISPKDYEAYSGYGVAPDINTRGDLLTVGRKGGASSEYASKVTVLERARNDWRLVSTLEPQTPTNIGTQGANDGYGYGGQGSTVGGSGDFLVVGAHDRRVTVSDAATQVGAAFIYYSILDETGSYELTIAPPLNRDLKADQNASFHQRSLITASGHTFEYVGSGTNMFTAIPQNGGIPKKENEVIFDSADAAEPNFGLVYFTATDELGDFRIGEDLTINREEGTITGVTFDRSLFAVLTPFILALEG